jgi:hypothetical protein
MTDRICACYHCGHRWEGATVRKFGDLVCPQCGRDSLIEIASSDRVIVSATTIEDVILLRAILEGVRERNPITETQNLLGRIEGLLGGNK